MAEQRKTTGPTISSTSPPRAIGTRFMYQSVPPGTASCGATISVSIRPGATALVRTPKGARSRASACVSERTAPLDAM